MRTCVLALLALTLPLPAFADEALSPEAVNTAPIPTELTGSGEQPDPAVVHLQVLLDRVGASPGVIDGFDGENVRKAIAAFEMMQGLPVDGMLDAEVVAALPSDAPALGEYRIVEQDLDAIGPPVPKDFSEQAKRDFLGYASVEERLAERFHMDIDLLIALNPGARFSSGDLIFVAAYGPDRTGEVTRIEADKAMRQVRAYDADNRLIAAYPATIGSEQNPSPSGSYTVNGVAPMPEYTYNPENFRQGDNTEILTLPPGPNGPVGSMWIDLSKPSFGIHGTPEPSLIDKTASHGCVRLTNWDANELAKMVKPGVRVDFVG